MTDEQKLDQLMCALDHPVNQIPRESGAEEIKTWSDLIKRLRSRYGSTKQSALYQVQLNTRKHKYGEDINTLAQDVRRLLTLAYPGPPTVHSDILATKAFLDALSDKSLALKVREREPVTLDQACKIALRLEGYKKRK